MSDFLQHYRGKNHNLRKYLQVLAITTVILLFMFTVHLNSIIDTENQSTKAVLNTNPQYTLKVLENNIVIYSPNQSSPILVTNIDVRTLPTSEQNALLDGIIINSDVELSKALENYSS